MENTPSSESAAAQAWCTAWMDSEPTEHPGKMERLSGLQFVKFINSLSTESAPFFEVVGLEGWKCILHKEAKGAHKMGKGSVREMSLVRENKNGKERGRKREKCRRRETKKREG